MVLDKLSDSLKGVMNKISGALFIDEKLINELVKEIQKALLTADVNVKLVLDLTQKIKSRITSEDAPSGLHKKEWLIKIVYDELVNFLGSEEGKIEIVRTPMKIMLVGLFGNGKTTTAGKLANYFKKRGHKVAMISTDTWRPAAYEQLRQNGERIGVDVFGNPKEKDPTVLYKSFESELSKYEIVIIDTAGRDALSDELITELVSINDAVKPNHSLLVMGADIGQSAQRQAQVFHETCNVTGVIITKLDGTAKGGGALSACSITGAKVIFIGVGEKIDDFEKYKPKNFVSKLLGMGDIEGLLEKANLAISQDEAEDLSKKLLKGEFNLIDLYEQMSAMRKMGPLSKVMEMIPGFGSIKMPKEVLANQEVKLDSWKFIMNSCTKKELEDPEIIDKPRMERIAVGSGRSINDIREMLKQYKQSKKMMKMFKGVDSEKGMQNAMKKMSGMKGMIGR